MDLRRSRFAQFRKLNSSFLNSIPRRSSLLNPARELDTAELGFAELEFVKLDSAELESEFAELNSTEIESAELDTAELEPAEPQSLISINIRTRDL